MTESTRIPLTEILAGSNIVEESFGSVNLNKVPDRVALYMELAKQSEPCFQLSGKKLEEACKEHANNLMFYDQMLQECKTVEDSIRVEVEKVEGDLYKKYNENHSRALGTRDIQSYIKGDQKYVDVQKILIEVVHAKRMLEAVVEALKSMGWTLGHVVKLRIAQLEDTIL